MEILAEQLGLRPIVLNWMAFFVLAFIFYFLFRKIFHLGANRLQKFTDKTKSDIDDVVVHILKKTTGLFFVAVSFYAASAIAQLPPKFELFVNRAFIVVSLFQCAIWALLISNVLVEHLMARRMTKDDGSQRMVRDTFLFGSKVIIWVLFLLLTLDNLGVDVTALIAGLGVAGIAVALAVQNILGDLFASISIVLDKPFVIGDFIVVGDKMGTVEKIGIKTTRVKALSGEQLVFTNADLLQSRIQNYKRMAERRIEFKFGVTYNTPLEKLKKIPEFCKNIITDLPEVRFDRAHFASFGAADLTFAVVYIVESGEFNKYMDIQQSINFELMRMFSEHEIEFAFPTQTLFLERGKSFSPPPKPASTDQP